MVDVETLIQLEVGLYIDYCRLASLKDENEQFYRNLAHQLFYVIQEMRTVKVPKISE